MHIVNEHENKYKNQSAENTDLNYVLGNTFWQIVQLWQKVFFTTKVFWICVTNSKAMAVKKLIIRVKWKLPRTM